jgi:putative transposase
MPRQPRLELPGIPMHVTQRGVNRCAIFLDDDDRHHYRRLLREACNKHAVAIHAFVLMDNHVHLLLSSLAAGAVSCAMRAVGQAYVQAFNARHSRSGTLWQGRFKSCLVDSDRYLLAVLRYIELNPVRAAMVAAPEEYRWSSVHTHLGRSHDPLLTPHIVYLGLGGPTPYHVPVHTRHGCMRSLTTTNVAPSIDIWPRNVRWAIRASSRWSRRL